MRPARCSNPRGPGLRQRVAALALMPALAWGECSCLWEGSFADVQSQADLVIAGTVVTRKGNALDLSVEEALRGVVYTQEIRVWAQTGDYCRPSADEFPPGSGWVMALKRIDEIPDGGFDPATPNQSYGRIGDYYLSSCGGYWLNYSGEAVTGNLVAAPRWARDPDMTPVLMGLLRAFLDGRADAAALLEASREDPVVKELMLDTKAFLRNDAAILEALEALEALEELEAAESESDPDPGKKKNPS